MFEEAFKKEPTNEDLGVQTFLANVRAGHWKTAQQVGYDIKYLYFLTARTTDCDQDMEAVQEGGIFILECNGYSPPGQRFNDPGRNASSTLPNCPPTHIFITIAILPKRRPLLSPPHHST